MAKRGMGSNLNYDGENADFDEFYKAFGYDASMYGWDKVQQAHVIQYCLSRKALRSYNGISEQDRKSIDRVFEELKATCFKPTEYYLNLFYGRTLNHGESMAGFAKDLERLVDKGLPGLDGAVRTKLLKSRLISSVPENIKNFLELLSDKSWKDLITIFENQVDYKSIVPGQFSQEIQSV